jgi:hypothetical protein
MAIPADQYKPDLKRTGSFFDWLKTVTAVARRLVRFLYLTDEDQEKAGIYLSNNK